MVDLTGKRALVCGATQGMGRACAAAMAKCGATVTLAARNPDSLATTVTTLDTSAGQKHATICQDFTDADALAAKVADHVKDVGAIHILLKFI